MGNLKPNIKIVVRIFFLSFLFAFLISCSDSGKKTLYLAATTDVHGVIFGKDPSNDRIVPTSMSKISGYLSNFDSDRLLLLDNGDNLQGTPSVYYFNFENTDIDHLWPKVMNYMNYSALTVGNHDIETGHDVYDRLESQFTAPLLAANAVNSSDGLPYFEPYTIIKKDGLKIAVLGLITPGVPSWLPEVLYKGMEFDDMVETAKKWMPEILENEPDLVVGLFHAGWNDTYGGGEAGSYLNQNASLSVAREVDGFDLVIIGHDHDLMNDYITNNNGDSVLILDGGSHARYISFAEITIEGKGTDRSIIIDSRMIKVDSLMPDPDFEKEFDAEYQLISEYITRKIGSLDQTMTSRESYFGDSRFMDFIHKVQMETSGADISFAAPLSFDVSIEAGDLTVADMFDLYRFENMLYTISLSGKEIDSYLEYSTSLWFNTLDNDNKTLLKYQENTNRLQNRSYYFDSASGIEYTIDLRKADGDKVTIHSFSDGRLFDEDLDYKVALNSYRGSGGGGHLSRGCGLSDLDIDKRVLSSTDKDLRYYMMKWIEQNKTITISQDNNWKLEPGSIIEEMIKREYKSLFNTEID